MSDKKFGYKPSDDGKANRSYELSDEQWCDLFVFMWACVNAGANPSLYTSQDGNALCLSVKHGKSVAKYWIGPDDVPSERIARAYREWGVNINLSNPIDEVIRQNIDREASILKDKGGTGT